MLISPTSSVLVSDVKDLFGSIFFSSPGQTFQIRKGRYVVNGHTYPYECLLLDENETIIDGYCGVPLPWLHWKGIVYVNHLLDLNQLDKPEWYDKMLNVDPEYLDKQHWSFSNK